MTRRLPYAGVTGTRGAFLKVVHKLTGARAHREVFADFLELAFCSVAKTTHLPGSPRADELEARYMRTAGARDPDYVRAMPELLAPMNEGVHELGDFLGAVAGELGGSGGMLLEVADVLEQRGYPPEQYLLARATDISATAFQMCYLQLAVRGVPATVHHGDALALESWGAEVTPALVEVAQDDFEAGRVAGGIYQSAPL